MRISYFYGQPFPSKAAAWIQILNTCRALAEQGADVALLTGRLTRPGPSLLESYGLTPHPRMEIRPLFAHPLARLSKTRGFPARLLLDRYCREQEKRYGEHVVVSRDDPGIRVFNALRKTPKPAGKRLYLFEAHRISHFHFAEREKTSAAAARRLDRLKREEAQALELADGVICLTRGLEEELRRVFHLRCPTLVLPSGCKTPAPEDDGENAPPRRDAPKDIDILYVGKLMERKGVESLVASLSHVAEARLWIVGGSEEEIRRLRETACRLGIAERVTLTGYVEPAKIRSCLARARVGVCPLPAGLSSVSERFTSPLKIVEMMASGLPIVASDVPAVRELLGHEKTALLVPPNDPQALAAAIGRLLGDPALSRRLAQAALEESRNYTWERRASRLIEFAEDLFADRRI